jgi:hypothetical protein
MTPILRPIVARINGLTNEIKRTKASTKLDHSKKQYVLAILKTEARHTMLSYAFTRGVPYLVVESACNERPNAWQVARIFASFNVIRHQSLIKKGTFYYSYHLWMAPTEVASDQERISKEIEEWLAAPPQLPKLPKSGIFRSLKALVGL